MSSSIPAKDKPIQWKRAPVLPDLPQKGAVTIVLEGLFSICYLDWPSVIERFRRQCQIGVFNQDSKHQLEITINGGSCTGGVTSYTYKHGELRRLAKEKFTIQILDSDADVSFYQKEKLFNRAKSTVNEDFRWLVDVETPDLYNKETKDKKAHYGPKVLVKNGVFFTSKRTEGENKFDFVVRPPAVKPVRELGYVAFQTAARIILSAGQVLEFKFKGPDKSEKTCTFKSSDFSAAILLQHICREDDGLKCKKSDFHLHFDSFTPPTGESKYDLKPRKALVDENVNPTNEEAVSDEAPCHSMGYGQSGGGTQP